MVPRAEPRPRGSLVVSVFPARALAVAAAPPRSSWPVAFLRRHQLRLDDALCADPKHSATSISPDPALPSRFRPAAAAAAAGGRPDRTICILLRTN